jgi:hypothetical protein
MVTPVGRSPRTLVVHSNDPDTAGAITDLLVAADEQLAGEHPVAGLLFAGIDVDHEAVLNALADRFGDIALVGCSTDGELSSVMSFQEDSLGLMLFVGDGIVARTAFATDLSDPAAAAEKLLADADFPGTPKVCFALPESLGVDALALVQRLAEALPPGTALVGGTSADQWRFRETRQFCGRQAATQAMPVLLLGGEIEVGVGVCSGWTPLGRIGRVTRAEGTMVYEIDGAPAVEFYREYLGHHVEPNPEFPSLVLEGDDTEGYLRAPFRYDAENGAIVYTAEVPVGAGIQVTTAPTGDILDACRQSVAQAMAGGAGAFAAIAVSCAARKQILGTRTPEECDILRSALGDGIPVLGFYAYGEIAPIGGRARADFHNETFVTVVLRRAAG